MEGTSRIYLDRSALFNNIKVLEEIMGKDVLMTSVVKANAYGHGIEEFVPMANDAGIRHFSVFNSVEASRVKDSASAESEIMIMGWMHEDEMEWAILNGISFYVFELNRLEHALEIAKQTGHQAKVHLEVETGMNRTGLVTKDLRKALKLLSDHEEFLQFTGLCTHFAGAESIANYYRVHQQLRMFNKYRRVVEKAGMRPQYYHTASSAAALNYPKSQMDMVRIGIAQYGFWPSRETLMQYLSKRVSKIDPLQRVMSWKTYIMSVKEVKTGEFVSYGTTYLAQEDKRIAIVPVGYANGYNRSLSNQGRLLIGGQRVAVIGLVNMNMLIADISGVPDAQVGDEVVLIGKQGDLEITVASFSEISEQLNYELLTRLPQNISRIVLN